MRGADADPAGRWSRRRGRLHRAWPNRAGRP